MNWISDSVLQVLSDAAKNEHTSNLFSEKALDSIRKRTTKEDDEVIIGVLQRYLAESKKHENYSIREQTVDNVRYLPILRDINTHLLHCCCRLWRLLKQPTPRFVVSRWRWLKLPVNTWTVN